MKVYAFIPLRCGSKSIPGKNIRDFYGKPLIYWTLKAANGAKFIDKVIVATDCDEIENVILNYSFNKVKVYRRLPENARDVSSTESVMLEYLKRHNFDLNDILVLIQATSPFTQSLQLDEAISSLGTNGTDSILSCAVFKRFIWNSEGVPLNYDHFNRPRRQDFNDCYIENGAFYISRIKNILNTENRISGKIALYKMPEYTQLELDEEEDWKMGERLMAKYLNVDDVKYSDIKLFLSDIDGVLTDSGMYYSENGDELKKFSTYDGMGFQLLKQKGILTGLMTKEERALNKRRFEKLKLDYYFDGVSDKLKVLEKLCKKLSIKLDNVAFVGDDINDLEVLKNVGFPACPASAQDEIKNIPSIKVLSKKGGEGAVREFVNIIIKNVDL